jgi:undecaprenyl-diphosphatase
MNQTVDVYNEKLFLWMNGNHSSFLDLVMLSAGNILTFVCILAICAFFGIRYFKRSDGAGYPFFNAALLILILVGSFFLCRIIVPGIFPAFLEMPKPCTNPRLEGVIRVLTKKDCNPTYSLFSATTCVMFCICSFMLFTLRNKFFAFKTALIIWTLLLAYSRIYIGTNYPANVLIAAVTGICIGYMVSRVFYYLKAEFFVI